MWAAEGDREMPRHFPDTSDSDKMRGKKSFAVGKDTEGIEN